MAQDRGVGCRQSVASLCLMVDELREKLEAFQARMATQQSSVSQQLRHLDLRTRELDRDTMVQDLEAIRGRLSLVESLWPRLHGQPERVDDMLHDVESLRSQLLSESGRAELMFEDLGCRLQEAVAEAAKYTDMRVEEIAEARGLAAARVERALQDKLEDMDCKVLCIQDSFEDLGGQLASVRLSVHSLDARLRDRPAAPSKVSLEDLQRMVHHRLDLLDRNMEDRVRRGLANMRYKHEKQLWVLTRSLSQTLEMRGVSARSHHDASPSRGHARPDGDTSRSPMGQAAGPWSGEGRAMCIFGERCYETDLRHREKYSHPGDPDFPAVKGPLCATLA